MLSSGETKVTPSNLPEFSVAVNTAVDDLNSFHHRVDIATEIR